MTRLSEDRIHMLTSMLQQAGASLPCPRCGRSDVQIIDGYIPLHLQAQLRNEVIGGNNRVSCVATVCRQCGYLSPHLLDMLDPSANS